MQFLTVLRNHKDELSPHFPAHKLNLVTFVLVVKMLHRFCILFEDPHLKFVSKIHSHSL